MIGLVTARINRLKLLPVLNYPTLSAVREVNFRHTCIFLSSDWAGGRVIYNYIYVCRFETRVRILLPCVAIYTLIRAYLDRSSSSEYFFVLLDKQYLELFMKTFCLEDE